MRFLVGAVAVIVICALFGAPAALLLGWSPLTASNRQMANTSSKAVRQLPSRPKRNSTGQARQGRFF